MTVNTPSKDGGRDLRERLEDIPRGRLVAVSYTHLTLPTNREV